VSELFVANVLQGINVFKELDMFRI